MEEAIRAFAKAYKHALAVDREWQQVAAIEHRWHVRVASLNRVRTSDALLEQARVLLFQSIGEDP